MIYIYIYIKKIYICAYVLVIKVLAQAASQGRDGTRTECLGLTVFLGPRSPWFVFLGLEWILSGSGGYASSEKSQSWPIM